jgi:hypothetical protein
MQGSVMSSGIDTGGAIYRSVAEIIGEHGIRQTFSPIDRISGLPNAAYQSDAWLELEHHRIFRRGWVFAGAAGEFTRKGAIKPIEIGGTGIFLVKGNDGRIRAFHNVCPHRGTQLIDSPLRQARDRLPVSRLGLPARRHDPLASAFPRRQCERDISRSRRPGA